MQSTRTAAHVATVEPLSKEELHPSSLKFSEPPTVPTIDFGSFNSVTGDGAKHVADQIVKAALDTGFFYLSNHGVPQKDIDDMFELVTKRFFAKGSAHNAKYPYNPEINSGYLGIATERLNPNSDEQEYKEAVNIPKLNGRTARKEDFAPELVNNWELLTRFHRSAHDCLLRVLRAFGMGLKIPESAGGLDYFTSCHRYEESSADILRILWYPAIPADRNTKWTRAAAHSDYGSLTLLFQDSTGGLEALLRSGNHEPKWIPLPPRPGTIVVNTGDLMEFWTEGLVKSTAHRVVFPDGPAAHQDRYTIAYFGQPEDSTPLTTIPSEIVKGKVIQDARIGNGEALFRGPTSMSQERAMTALEHLRMRLSEIH
ncbi:hypothetical protein SpCBS45565_g07583 [Spizellomyces sp. 'palustris']|nr:hypothetical protein SpCBS45565_g07583 [Spizellomyces sp. 'palustris']